MPTRRLSSVLGRAVGAAALAFVLGGIAAGALLYEYAHTDLHYEAFGPGIHMMFTVLLGFPAAAAILLWVFRVRPAWPVVVVGEVILIPELWYVRPAGGDYFPWWGYGIEAAAAYLLAALVVFGGVAYRSTRGSTDPGRSPGGSGGS